MSVLACVVSVNDVEVGDDGVSLLFANLKAIWDVILIEIEKAEDDVQRNGLTTVRDSM
jgi:hypothetical protein